eukprot:SAG11_NODE_1647_length_4512_cov_6.823929_5_plen_57_part_00
MGIINSVHRAALLHVVRTERSGDGRPVQRQVVDRGRRRAEPCGVPGRGPQRKLPAR